jgi:hypothetical protein
VRHPVKGLLALDRPAERRPRAGRVFRHVDTEAGTIRLGEPWVSSPVVVLAADCERRSVRLYRSSQGIVRAFLIEYPRAVDFDALMASHGELLGAPVAHGVRRTRAGVQWALWEDDPTRLELMHDPQRRGAAVFTLVTDRSGRR